MPRKEWKQPWPVTDSPVQIPPEALGDSWKAFLFENMQVLMFSSTKNFAFILLCFCSVMLLFYSGLCLVFKFMSKTVTCTL